MYQFHVYLQRKVLHTQLRRSSQGQEILWTSEIYRSHDLIFYSNLHPFFTIWLEWFLTLPFLQASGVSCTTLFFSLFAFVYTSHVSHYFFLLAAAEV